MTVWDTARTTLFSDPNLTESVVYRTKNGADRTLKAIVTRPLLPQQQAIPRGMPQAKVKVQIANEATLGVTSIYEGLDELDLFLRLGDRERTTCRVAKVLSHDEVAWHLEVEA